MSEPARRAVEAALGVRVRDASRLAGGCVAQAWRLDLEDGRAVVAKTGSPADRLDLEAWMLRELAGRSRLPVPGVLHAAPDLLVIEFVEGGDPIDASVERHAADLLADLHAVRGPSFGMDRDTLIGGLPQPNAPCDSWVAFYAERRLLHMGREALSHGGIDAGLMRRLESLCARLGEIIDEPPHPSLLHGDVWGGNVIARAGRVAAFIDPAIYHGHPEVELAFITLFTTFGRAFFERYAELRQFDEGFWDQRREVYLLYPLLVHARLFGGGYGAQAASILRGLGF
ncbi:MAG TPA: fructosamine kinase family protein [Phycisphaerales bacterium]|nr:fructosamine kinase family protein [Phycisphaerales bacterium]